MFLDKRPLWYTHDVTRSDQTRSALLFSLSIFSHSIFLQYFSQIQHYLFEVHDKSTTFCFAPCLSAAARVIRNVLSRTHFSRALSTTLYYAIRFPQGLLISFSFLPLSYPKIRLCTVRFSARAALVTTQNCTTQTTIILKQFMAECLLRSIVCSSMRTT